MQNLNDPILNTKGRKMDLALMFGHEIQFFGGLYSYFGFNRINIEKKNMKLNKMKVLSRSKRTTNWTEIWLKFWVDKTGIKHLHLRRSWEESLNVVQ